MSKPKGATTRARAFIEEVKARVTTRDEGEVPPVETDRARPRSPSRRSARSESAGPVSAQRRVRIAVDEPGRERDEENRVISSSSNSQGMTDAPSKDQKMSFAGTFRPHSSSRESERDLGTQVRDALSKLDPESRLAVEEALVRDALALSGKIPTTVEEMFAECHLPPSPEGAPKSAPDGSTERREQRSPPEFPEVDADVLRALRGAGPRAPRKIH